MGFNDGLGMAGSLYAATANPAPARPALTGACDADLVVVGGGCTGLSAALHAAQRGLSVVVLEGGRVGWGASGRNGGQIIPGLRQGATALVRRLGEERARTLLDLAFEARDLVVGLIERHGIQCDLRLTGHLLGAVKKRDLRWMEAEVASLEALGYPHAELWPAERTAEEVDAGYHGALVDRAGGHMHPLNYALGLAAAAEAAGARLRGHLRHPPRRGDGARRLGRLGQGSDGDPRGRRLDAWARPRRGGGHHARGQLSDRHRTPGGPGRPHRP